MSVFTFLCFFSLIYLASADPVPPSTTDVEGPPAADLQAGMQQMFDEIDNVLQNRLPPMTKMLDPDDQEYLKFTAEEGIKGILNFLRYLIRSILESKRADPDPEGILVTFMESELEGDFLAYKPFEYFIAEDQAQATDNAAD